MSERDERVHVEVSGLTGTGKSAVMGEIEIALRALGLSVEHDADFQSEKNMTHADWQTALDLYKPTVVLSERNIPRAKADTILSPRGKSVGQRAFEWMRDTNNALPGAKKDARDWVDLTPADREAFEADAARRPQLYRSEPTPRGEQTEAVAWRYREPGAPEWEYRSSALHNPHGYEVQPLYAHPAEAPSVVLDQGARDLLAELVGDKLAELDDTLGCRAQEGGGGSTEDERSLRKDLHAILAALSPQALGEGFSALRASPSVPTEGHEAAVLDKEQLKAIERAAMDAGCTAWRRCRLAMVEGDKIVGYPAFSRADMAELARLYREADAPSHSADGAA